MSKTPKPAHKSNTGTKTSAIRKTNNKNGFYKNFVLISLFIAFIAFFSTRNSTLEQLPVVGPFYAKLDSSQIVDNIPFLRNGIDYYQKAMSFEMSIALEEEDDHEH